MSANTAAVTAAALAAHFERDHGAGVRRGLRRAVTAQTAE
eukprot:SAG11_NODE_7711_length_1097_cov_0.630586_2_plen_39_part_01